MKFDKSKVYTALNADELKAGSKVIVADTMEILKDRVAQDGPVETLKYVQSESALYRFKTQDRFKTQGQNALAYLVEEPAKLQWTDLKVGDIIQNGKLTAMVTSIDSDPDEFHIYAGDVWFSDKELTYWRKVEQ